MAALKPGDMILGSGISFSKDIDIAKSVVSTALKNGLYRFDSAPSYKTESLLGKILNDQIERGAITRESIYIQTKIDAWQMQDKHGRNIMYHVESALKKFQTDYLDSLLIHWPVPEYMEETWRQFEFIKNQGIVRKIGICNVRIRQLNEYVSWKPDIIQIERHPLNTFRDEVEFCHNEGIEIQAYSPLCKMDGRIKNNPILEQLSEKYGKDIGQIVLRWHIDTGVIPVFTTTKPSRIDTYSEIDNFALAADEIEMVYDINENYKMYLESIACPGF